ncbi:glycosyltransferase [Salinibacter ruber]|uniref:Glycosyltransferase involved in cell wall biosynthesis n=1 Tax=Salinibacter ruber TaxID=146919 RepID=A0A9X2U6W6_9BACT|nr:glycosyltransferase [Salinibacter ruber]MCS3950924.1 glycosyltransferase involved in cell wall biosynthesis [Salinibacter ruber]
MKSVSIVTGKSPNAPSVKNLAQGLNGTNTFNDIKIHCIRPNYEGNKIPRKISYACKSIFESIYKMQEVLSSDVCVIHKKVSKAGFGLPVLESIFARANKVVYSTYDGVYLHSPKIAKYLFRKSDIVLATSHEIKKQASKIAKKDKVFLIPPSVDTTIFNNDKPNKKSGVKKVVGWVGNMKVHKNDLIKMLKGTKELDKQSTKLILVGKKNSSVIKEAKKSGLTVEALGYVDHSKIPEIIKGFDIGVAPLEKNDFNKARSSEKVREYMACGVPVLASDVGENKFLVEEGCGHLVSRPENWGKHIQDMLSDDERRKKMGKKARRHAVKNYSINRVASLMDDVLSQI